MSKVHAIESAAVHFEGGVIGIREGSTYDENDPIVIAHPALFGIEVSRRGRRTRVEQATAAPGEIRDL